MRGDCAEQVKDKSKPLSATIQRFIGHSGNCRSAYAMPTVVAPALSHVCLYEMTVK